VQTKEEQIHEELQDLIQEVEDYKKEKERVREIVGKIGGAPTTTTKYLNIIFIVFVLADLMISLASEGKLRLAMVELAIFAISLKLIYLIHKQSRVNHLQTWILSSLEWRVNEVLKEIRVKDK
jgi:hypothetical protein